MRKIKIIASMLFVLNFTHLFCQENLLINVYNRSTESLNWEMELYC